MLCCPYCLPDKPLPGAQSTAKESAQFFLKLRRSLSDSIVDVPKKAVQNPETLASPQRELRQHHCLSAAGQDERALADLQGGRYNWDQLSSCMHGRCPRG